MDNHIARIETPANIVQGTNGEPAYILLRTRFKNKHLLAFNKALRLNAEISKFDLNHLDEAGQKQVLQIAEALNQAVEDVFSTYATLVIDWNWLDDETGQPLPKPLGHPEVFKAELYEEQVSWIREQIQNVQRYRATEGNAPSTTP